MNNQNYKQSITVKARPEDAYIALTSGIEHWWTKPDKLIQKVGDQAKFSFSPNSTYWTFEATTLIPDERVELVCVDAKHIHEGIPQAIEKEWLNTKIVFEIEKIEDGSLIHFTHEGLNPSLLCYDVCEAGWNFFFFDSLLTYLNTGAGKPHQATG